MQYLLMLKWATSIIEHNKQIKKIKQLISAAFYVPSVWITLLENSTIISLLQ